MKRVWITLLAVLFLFAIPCTAAPAVTDQIMELREENGKLTVTATQPVTFWEQPTLRAGETVTVAGKLTLTNTTDSQQTLSLKTVKLPYGDEAALEYLNHLHLKVYLGEAMQYNNLYSRINTENNLHKDIVLEAGASITYTLYLTCDYSYSGADFTNSAVLDWEFLPQLLDEEQVEEEPNPPINDPLLTQWLIVGVLTVIALIGLPAILKRSRR